MKEQMKSFHEILPGFSPCRNSQHPCRFPTSLHDLQAKNQTEEQPLTERQKDPARQLLKPSLQTLNCCSHKPPFCPLLFTNTCMDGFCSHRVGNNSLLVNPKVSVCLSAFGISVCCFIHNVQDRPVKSSDQCWLHISRHLKSLALRRQLMHHFLKPLQAAYQKKPLITTINLVLVCQVVSRNLGFGDQRAHKYKD